MGDYYFQDVSIEEASALVKCRSEPIHDENELMRFLETILPTRIPLHKPPWEVHVFPEYNSNETAVIIKQHHSLGDGLSA